MPRRSDDSTTPIHRRRRRRWVRLHRRTLRAGRGRRRRAACPMRSSRIRFSTGHCRRSRSHRYRRRPRRGLAQASAAPSSMPFAAPRQGCLARCEGKNPSAPAMMQPRRRISITALVPMTARSSTAPSRGASSRRRRMSACSRQRREKSACSSHRRQTKRIRTRISPSRCSSRRSRSMIRIQWLQITMLQPRGSTRNTRTTNLKTTSRRAGHTAV